MTAIETTGQELTPELLDLMEHEKIIEQGLATWVEVGLNLLAIRDGKKYRAGGYSTFEDYCGRRWEFTDRRARQLMAATRVAIEAEKNGTTVPVSEREARRMLTPPKRDHPAPFSDPILDAAARSVQGADTVLDPFAGTGRVHELRERAGVRNTIGVEIEPEWASKHPDTIQGDALDLPQADNSVDAIVTSPTYGNRMADHHDAKDESTRLTYKHTLGRELADHNSGQLQWGDEYREFHVKAWAEAIRVLRRDGTFVVNVKDHIRAGQHQPVVGWHVTTLCRLGLDLEQIEPVPTRGLRVGENADIRTGYEFVLTFRKA